MSFLDFIPGEAPGEATEEESLAVEQLRPLCAPDCVPTLSDLDLLRIVRASRRWRTWQPGLSLSLDEMISPTTFSGVGWRCVGAGVTGETEPPAFAASNVEEGLCYGKIRDNTALMQCNRAISASPFDIRRAAHAAWTEKAVKTYREHNHSPGGNQRFDRAAIHDHCRSMAASFAPIRAV